MPGPGGVALTDVTIYGDAFAYKPVSSEFSAAGERAAVQATVFGSGGAHEWAKGLEDVTATLAGNWGSATTGGVDEELWLAHQQDGERLWTVSMAETATQPAWAFKAAQMGYGSPAGKLGELGAFEAALAGKGGYGLLRGQLAKPKSAVAATGQLGSVVTLGAPITGQRLFAILHVFTPPASITVQVQSDDNAGMTSPTVRGTIGPITAAGATFMTPLAGPLPGEQFFRMNVSALTGTGEVAGFLAVV
ncbi:hypothetical protein [Cryptosporangium sp. NPDC051539]|uniref:hypothetical protein n=1 Tax=Cryptosporangium sp. NPDC051539 TaxID=3363962 RepID=UPI00378E95CA